MDTMVVVIKLMSNLCDLLSKQCSFTIFYLLATNLYRMENKLNNMICTAYNLEDPRLQIK